MTKPLDFDSIRSNARKFLEETPADRDTFLEYYASSYESGAIDTKTKRLMAMCGGLVAGCTGCIIGQLEMAIQEGATREEVLESCAVAMSLGGTMAWSQIAKVMDYLNELEED